MDEAGVSLREIDVVEQDIGPIRISDEKFLKEDRGETGFNRIGYDEQGDKYMVKTNIWMVTPKEQLSGIDLEAEKPYIEDGLRSEEAAWRLAQSLGVPMAETRYVQINGIAWTAARFIEGAKDRGFGGGFDANLASIKDQLARIGVFKFIIKAGGDSGQYLEAPGNQAFIMDVQLVPTVDIDVDETDRELLEEMLSHRRSEAFGGTLDVVSAQLDAVAESLVEDLFDRAEQLTPDWIVGITKEMGALYNGKQAEFAREIVNRAQRSRRIFKYLASHKDLAIKALNPYSPEIFKRVASAEESKLAKERLLQEFEQN